MKSLKIFSILLVLMFLFTNNVFAVEYVKSINVKNSPEVVDFTIESSNGDKVETGDTSLIVVPLSDANDSLKAAYNELKESSLTDLVQDFDTIWTEVSNGAPVENAVVCDLFNVYLSGVVTSLREGEHVTIILSPETNIIGKSVVLIHEVDGEWVNLDYEINDDGNIVVDLYSLGNIAIIVDGETVYNGTISPVTGINSSNYVIAVSSISAVILALGVFLVIKSKKMSSN